MSWKDMPNIVESCKVVTRLFLREGISVEIRVRGEHLSNNYGIYFVTFGNLFGSDTIECKTVGSVFRVLEIIGKNVPSKLPLGCVLMEAEEGSNSNEINCRP